MRLPATILLLAFFFTADGEPAPKPQPAVFYTLRVDSADLSGYTVSIQIRNAPHRFRLAMATHHEYDDRFWRYVTGFHAESPATFSREDSAVWTIATPGDDASVTYRIQLPPPGPYHFSHRSFLRGGACPGGLVGDIHAFMYLVDDPQAVCSLRLELPVGWGAASGLRVAPGKRNAGAQLMPNFLPEFYAGSAATLLDAPILVGRLHRWRFMVDGIVHDVVYLPANPTLTFDTLALVANIQQLVRATKHLFGAFPYSYYSFLLEDSCEGALEHGNSLTLGVSAGALANPHSDMDEEIAHEFFHTWNLMAIRPAPYTDLNFGPQEQSPGLWFSEGFTMLYADLLCRRLRLPAEDSTRIAHLAGLITRYYADTGNAALPPSRVSLASNLQPGPLGDYEASTHLQGELLGDCLDMLIRDATDGHRSLDDVMKWVYRRFGRHQPLSDSNVEAAVTSVCRCSAAHAFFQTYLRDGNPIDFNASLRLFGLRIRRDQTPATDKQGQALPDKRIYPWILRNDTSLRILITNPNSCWALGGLHTGDIVGSAGGRSMHTPRDFQSILAAVRIGDTVTIEIKKGTESVPHKIVISGYTRPVIHISEDPAASPKQRRLLHQWVDVK